ncbi:hypothetical protein CALCODRAFT_282382 [Calocera cornea HHB12733]|uniref:Uncharacterized protein n=1 Tax=Calocera cornea HHB12733 TaxID=1353952 RepID=A0A165FY49_9BASI|nr:hypothetical protein CALCODRAFT_282382 [Calocera cornea HHB12733]
MQALRHGSALMTLQILLGEPVRVMHTVEASTFRHSPSNAKHASSLTERWRSRRLLHSCRSSPDFLHLPPRSGTCPPAVLELRTMLPNPMLRYSLNLHILLSASSQVYPTRGLRPPNACPGRGTASPSLSFAFSFLHPEDPRRTAARRRRGPGTSGTRVALLCLPPGHRFSSRSRRAPVAVRPCDRPCGRAGASRLGLRQRINVSQAGPGVV